MINTLTVNHGFPSNMTESNLRPTAVVEIYVDSKVQNCIVVSLEKVAKGWKGERHFMALSQDGKFFRTNQLMIVRLINHSLTFT